MRRAEPASSTRSASGAPRRCATSGSASASASASSTRRSAARARSLRTPSRIRASVCSPNPFTARTRPSRQARSRSSRPRIPSAAWSAATFFGPRSGTCSELERARRVARAEPLEQLGRAGPVEVRDLPRERVADPLHLEEPARADERAEVLGEPLDRARAVLVGAHLEGVLALQLEQRPNLPQRPRHAELVEHPAVI